MKNARNQFSKYLNTIRIVSEVLVFHVEKCCRIGIISGQFTTLQTLLNFRDAPAAHTEIRDEQREDDDFHRSHVQKCTPVVTEENHDAMVRVVLWVVWIIRVYSTGAPEAIPERFSLWWNLANAEKTCITFRHIIKMLWISSVPDMPNTFNF